MSNNADRTRYPTPLGSIHTDARVHTHTHKHTPYESSRASLATKSVFSFFHPRSVKKLVLTVGRVVVRCRVPGRAILDYDVIIRCGEYNNI